MESYTYKKLYLFVRSECDKIVSRSFGSTGKHNSPIRSIIIISLLKDISDL